MNAWRFVAVLSGFSAFLCAASAWWAWRLNVSALSFPLAGFALLLLGLTLAALAARPA